MSIKAWIACCMIATVITYYLLRTELIAMANDGDTK
jgi:hypothetical protein